MHGLAVLFRTAVTAERVRAALAEHPETGFMSPCTRRRRPTRWAGLPRQQAAHGQLVGGGPRLLPCARSGDAAVGGDPDTAWQPGSYGRRVIDVGTAPRGPSAPFRRSTTIDGCTAYAYLALTRAAEMCRS
ncbi:hypothetical protein TNCT6_76200 [Streptomyces sp. 6-11-2]|nr:hypothetical protein TNCT6_76200 [Streptomyces sp. 6-11-2]